MKENTIREIHESLINGQRKQMVKQIDRYGTYNFWSDYKCFLFELYVNELAVIEFFTDATISYFRIKGR